MVVENEIAYLPKAFAFNSPDDLVRLGRDNDGGYLVRKSDVLSSDVLISLGICDDWSFESDFVKYNDISVDAYDGSLNLRFWIKRGISNFLNAPFSFYLTKKLFSYYTFFRGKRRLFRKYVSIKCNKQDFCDFENIILNSAANKIFLKIDIEGSEYRILETILKNQNRINGLIIEFHDCDIHLDTIINFIKDFNLQIVHIHANNYAPIRLKDGLPLALELTFSSSQVLINSLSLPHKLDMPNCKNYPEIMIRYLP